MLKMNFCDSDNRIKITEKNVVVCRQMGDHKAKVAGLFILSNFEHLILFFGTCPTK